MRIDPATPAPEDPSEALVPQAGPDFVAAFLLTALRVDGRDWLGRDRLGALAAALKSDEATLLGLLDRPPKPPPALGEAVAWFARRVPILQSGRLCWAELFWRPDPKWHIRRLGSFALRLVLPGAGGVELRGRVEEGRLDAVLHAQTLSREAAWDAQERFRHTLRRLGLAGELSVRTGVGG